MSLRVFDEHGNGTTSSVIEAIEYAKQCNIKLLNYSGGLIEYDKALNNAINDYKGLFVCSAGNNGEDLDTNGDFYPAEFSSGNIISVASCDYFDFLLGNSNFGRVSVDLAAPGENILSTCNNSYEYKTGTSMAAPQVTGVAALIWSKYPNLSVAEVKSAILNNVDKVDYLNGKVKTNGRLNAYKALLSVENKHFTVKFNGNGGIGAINDLLVIYGNATQLPKNEFVKNGYKFIGWYAHRSGDNKWIYTNGIENAWYVENEQPNGYFKAIYNEDAKISKTSEYNNDIVTMYAKWLLTGDVDFDGRASVIDATCVQKHVAKIITLNKNEILVADVDDDERVSVKDATAIQKMIVGF